MSNTTFAARYLAALSLIIAVSPASAAVTLDSASLAVITEAPVRDEGDAAITGPADTPITRSAHSSGATAFSSAEASAVATVVLHDTATGDFMVDAHSTTTRQETGSGDYPQANEGSYFTYLFTVDQVSRIQLNYRFATSDDEAFFEAFLTDAQHFGIFDTYNTGSHSTGAYTSDAFGPGSYILVLNGHAGAALPHDMGATNDTTLSGAAHFAILQAAVPEASTWATMLLGFGAIGAMVRRRRGNAVTMLS